MEIKENIPLAPFTTLEVGGPARYFVSARCEEDLIAASDFAATKKLPMFILGGGSNIVVSDKGFNGLVIKISIFGIATETETVTAAAGENWDTFVERCVSADLAGIECLSGIPGTVGGTPVQNVGAYGQDVSQTIVSVRCYDRLNNAMVKLSNSDCGFGYRTSIFNTSSRDRFVVLSVTYALKKSVAPQLVYKDLVEHFAGYEPSLRETRDAVLMIRRTKSMVIDANDENRRSVGSFFKNPVVEKHKYEQIVKKWGSAVPHFPASAEHVKIPAAWLIEHAGFRKGYKMGNVGISTRHTLAIVNRGGATAFDIVTLGDKIKCAVSDEFGIEMIPEPILIGEF